MLVSVIFIPLLFILWHWLRDFSPKNGTSLNLLLGGFSLVLFIGDLVFNLSCPAILVVVSALLSGFLYWCLLFTHQQKDRAIERIQYNLPKKEIGEQISAVAGSWTKGGQKLLNQEIKRVSGLKPVQPKHVEKVVNRSELLPAKILDKVDYRNGLWYYLKLQDGKTRKVPSHLTTTIYAT